MNETIVCNNCGNESHCGEELVRDFHAKDIGYTTTLCVCDTCNCTQCNQTEEGTNNEF